MYLDRPYAPTRPILQILDDLGPIGDQLAHREAVDAERLYDLVLALRAAVDAQHLLGEERFANRLNALVGIVSDATYLYAIGRPDAATILARSLHALQSAVAAHAAYAVGAELEPGAAH